MLAAPPPPPFCACEDDLKSRSALLRPGRTNLPPGEERETGEEGGGRFLIVRSLGAGTDDPLGALSAFVRGAGRLKLPTSLRESQD